MIMGEEVIYPKKEAMFVAIELIHKLRDSVESNIYIETSESFAKLLDVAQADPINHIYLF